MIVNNNTVLKKCIRSRVYETAKKIFPEIIFKRETSIKEKKLSPIITDIITNRCYEGSKLKLFSKIEIETVNRCNNICPFCPVNRNIDDRVFKIMDEKLFKKIINELSAVNYSGAIAIFSNNEPLLDKRIISFVKYTKEKLPNAFNYLYTNGMLLTKEVLIDLMANLDYLIIDNYNDKLELNDNIKSIYEYCRKHKLYTKKIQAPTARGFENKTQLEIHLRKQHEKLSTRGGNAPNRSKDINTINASCILPFCQMIIRPDGKVSLCCNDAKGQYTLGDLNKEKIIDVWYGRKYLALRKSILKSRKGLLLCNKCDLLAVD